MAVKYSSISLIAENIVCVRGYRPLFKPLSFSLQNGEILLLRGENGAGKTTCLRTLTGLLPVEQGFLYWQDKLLKSYFNEYLQSMAYLGHQLGIKAALSPLENIRQSLLLAGHRISKESIVGVLDELGLSSYTEMPCEKLSSGQQRKVNLARLALITIPLWILDEPLTALDQSGIQWVQGKLKEHQTRGGSVILTSHQHLSVATREIVLEPWV